MGERPLSAGTSLCLTRVLLLGVEAAGCCHHIRPVPPWPSCPLSGVFAGQELRSVPMDFTFRTGLGPPPPATPRPASPPNGGLSQPWTCCTLVAPLPCCLVPVPASSGGRPRRCPCRCQWPHCEDSEGFPRSPQDSCRAPANVTRVCEAFQSLSPSPILKSEGRHRPGVVCSGKPGPF